MSLDDIWKHIHDFNELLEEDGCVAVYYQNIQQLAIKMFLNKKKAFKDLNTIKYFIN